MNEPVDHMSPTPAERAGQSERLTAVEAYGKPRKIWVDDGHVFVEAHDGRVVSMTPEVAIELSRRLGEAGAESLINKVMDKGEPPEAG